MVRNYKKKTNKSSWVDGQMQLAIDRVKCGKSISSSAQEFGVPRSTLQLKIREVEEGLSNAGSYKKGKYYNYSKSPHGCIHVCVKISYELLCYRVRIQKDLYGATRNCPSVADC